MSRTRCLEEYSNSNPKDSLIQGWSDLQLTDWKGVVEVIINNYYNYKYVKNSKSKYETVFIHFFYLTLRLKRKKDISDV